MGIESWPTGWKITSLTIALASLAKKSGQIRCIWKWAKTVGHPTDILWYVAIQVFWS